MDRANSSFVIIPDTELPYVGGTIGIHVKHTDFVSELTTEQVLNVIHSYESEVEKLRSALSYYSDPQIYVYGDVPGHIYAVDDSGRTAREALGLPVTQSGG